MFSNKSPTKPINNNLSIDFANDNFSLKNHFLLKTKTPNSLQNASSLFCAPLKLRSKTTRAWVYGAPLQNPFWLKSAVKADFLTPEPNISGGNLLAKNMILNVGNNLNVESKQTQEDSSSNGFGFNVGVGVGLFVGVTVCVGVTVGV